MCRSPQPNSAGGHADVLRLTVALCALAALAVPGQAASAGGNYLFVGGTKPQRKAVVSALEASSFNWTLVPGPITIHIAAGVDSTAAPGMIWLDADLLAAGPSRGASCSTSTHTRSITSSWMRPNVPA
jgi:hypothetical protein